MRLIHHDSVSRALRKRTSITLSHIENRTFSWVSRDETDHCDFMCFECVWVDFQQSDTWDCSEKQYTAIVEKTL